MPILLPSPNIRSQIERAVRAYLMDCGVATFEQFRLSHDYRERQVIDTKTGLRVPLIDIFGISASEEIKNSRVETWQVRIDPEYDAATQPSDTNPNWNWTAINYLTGLIMAAMSQTSNNGANYLDTALMISVFGRQLAVLGANGTGNDIADYADMALFCCDYVEYTSALGTGKNEGGGLVFKEQRNFQLRACNLDDDSVFPDLTFDGTNTLNWTFTASGTWPEPAQWNVEKSVDGFTWVTQEAHAAGVRASGSIAGTGTQFWRVTRTDASIPTYMPESNIVKVTGA